MLQYINYNQLIISYFCNFAMISVKVKDLESPKKSLSKVFFSPYYSTFKPVFVNYLLLFLYILKMLGTYFKNERKAYLSFKNQT